MRKIYVLFICTIACLAATAQISNSMRFNHVALSVKDVNKAADFYQSILGLTEITNRTKMDGIRWFSFGEGKELHLVSTIKEPKLINKAIHVALTTPSFDALIQLLVSKKIPYSNWPGAPNTITTRADGIKQVYFQDPDGYWIEVNSVAADNSEAINNKKSIADMLDSLNVYAAKADFNNYFNLYTEDGVFLGTDATEYWDKQAFMKFAKPYFDRGKAWNFKSIQRNIYLDASGAIAWFDELLSTQMKICRGSGVVVKIGDEWKIKQYVLSMTIPNGLVDSIIKLKATEEDSLIQKIRMY